MPKTLNMCRGEHCLCPGRGNQETDCKKDCIDRISQHTISPATADEDATKEQACQTPMKPAKKAARTANIR